MVEMATGVSRSLAKEEIILTSSSPIASDANSISPRSISWPGVMDNIASS